MDVTNHVAVKPLQTITPATGTETNTKVDTKEQMLSELKQNNETGNTEDKVTTHQIKKALDDANTKLRNSLRRCEFSYHEATNRISIKVYDNESNEIVREIPAEETLQTLEKIWEMAGLLVDEKR